EEPPVSKPQPAPVSENLPPVKAKSREEPENKVAEQPVKPGTQAAPRVSMRMMEDLDAAVNKAISSQDNEQKILTNERAQELFEEYKRRLQAADKNVIHSQFCMMRIEVL